MNCEGLRRRYFLDCVLARQVDLLFRCSLYLILNSIAKLQKIGGNMIEIGEISFKIEYF